MQIGIIKTWKEQDFIWCKEKGLDFIECDVNGPATNVDEYMTHIDELKGYIERKGAFVGSG